MGYMSDKILSEPKEGTTGFWGLRNCPETTVRMILSDEDEDLMGEDYVKYYEALESCKEKKLEIVNPMDVIRTFLDGTPCTWGKGDDPTGWYVIKPGDIIPLPIGYEFKEDFHHVNNGEWTESFKFLRLVKTETKSQENVSYNKSSETGNISEHKPYLDSVANLAHKCIQFNDGEMQGFDMVMFESLLPIILKPILNVPQPEPEESQESMINEIINLWRLGGNPEGIKSIFIIQRKKQ